MNRRTLILVVAALLVLVLIGVATGGFLYVRNATSNIYVTLERMALSSEVPAEGHGPLGLLTRGLASQVIVDATFQVDNRNPMAVTIDSIDYEVRVNGRGVGQGRAPVSGEQRVDAKATTQVVARTTMPLTSLLSAGAEGLGRGALVVDVQGKANVRVLFITLTHDFTLQPQRIDGQSLESLIRMR